MSYVATNYMTNPAAPVGKWVCSPGSSFGPFDAAPADHKAHPDYCGQCVSFVKQVCPTMPGTGSWKKGKQVKNNTDVTPGTVIATFNASNLYEGHAAIFVRQDTATGIYVYDQWVTGAPKAVGPRTLRWGAKGISNNGDNFYVVE
jgi:hypothetical protein